MCAVWRDRVRALLHLVLITMLMLVGVAASIRITRVPADANILFPTNARRLTRFMMDETYGSVRPLSAAWAQRGVLDAAADSDF